MPTEGHGVDLSAGVHPRGHGQSGFPWACVQCGEEQTGPLEDGCSHCGSGRNFSLAAGTPTTAQTTRAGVKAGAPPMPAPRSPLEIEHVPPAPSPSPAPSPAPSASEPETQTPESFPARISRTATGWTVEIEKAGRIVVGEGGSLAEATALAEERLNEEAAVLFDSRGEPIPALLQQAIGEALTVYLNHYVPGDDPRRPTLETWTLAIHGEA